MALQHLIELCELGPAIHLDMPIDIVWTWLRGVNNLSYREFGLTTFNEGTYLTFKSIFHKALNLF